MPTTAADLDRWAVTRDTDKFLQILRYLSGDKYLNMRLRAIEVLGTQYEERFVPVLLVEMGKSPNSRDIVAEKIAAWGSDAADYLCKYIQNSGLPKSIARQAVQAISKFDAETAYSSYLKLLLNHYGTGMICSILDSTGMITRFHELLGDVDPFLRWVGLEVIHQSPITRTACELLCANTRAEDVQIRSKCYSILADFINEKEPDKFRGISAKDLEEIAREPARRGLDDGEALVRRDSLCMIGSIRDEESVDRVICLSRDAYRYVRQEAVSALGRFPHHGTKQMLIGHYLDPENDDDHRAGALRALVTCLDEGCDEVLKGILAAEHDTWMLARVVEALMRKDPVAAIQFLVPEVLSKGRLREAISAYVRRSPGILQYIVGMVKYEQNKMRFRALIWLIGQLGDREVVLPLCGLADDSDDHVDLIAYMVYQILRHEWISMEMAHQGMEPSGGAGLNKVFQVILEHEAERDDDWNDPFMAELR